MLKLKILLRSKWFYFLGIILCLAYSLIVLMVPKESKIDASDNNYQGIITNIRMDGDWLELEIKGKEKIIGNYYFSSEEEKDNFSNNYQLGTMIKVVGSFSIPKNNTHPNLFNYRKYLYYQGIYYLMDIDQIEKISDNDDFLYSVKNIVATRIAGVKSRSYLMSFILGDTSLLDSDIKSVYQDIGISHLFAVSGMHVSFLSLMVLAFLKKLRVHEVSSYIMVTIFLIFYMFLIGCSPSVSRAVIFFVLATFSRIFKLELTPIKIWMLTFMIVVVRSPFFLFQVGFQFSFLISLYLILVQKQLRKMSKFSSMIMISLISFLASLPISLYYFYQVNFLSIIFNLVFVPLVSMIIFPLSLFTFLFPVLDGVLMFLISLLENLGNFANGIEIGKVIFGKPEIIWICGYYFIFTMFIYKKRLGFFIVLVLLVTGLYFSTILFPKDYFLMIDVGQGDSLLIHSKGKTMLIDTGGRVSFSKEKWQERKIKSISERTTIPLLKSLGIKRIDTMILTHGDFDHLGEAVSLIHNFPIGQIIFNDGELNTQELAVIDSANNKKISYYQDKQDNTYQVGNFSFISLSSVGESENDSSIVLLGKISSYYFLLTGDSTVEAEEKIINCYQLPNVLFLKVGHHGSKTSTSDLLLKAINPTYALISVGLNNRYNHPSSEVSKRLEQNNISSLLTSIHGSIQIIFNKSVTFSVFSP